VGADRDVFYRFLYFIYTLQIPSRDSISRPTNSIFFGNRSDPTRPQRPGTTEQSYKIGDMTLKGETISPHFVVVLDLTYIGAYPYIMYALSGYPVVGN
jgi:hypothetical protein